MCITITSRVESIDIERLILELNPSYRELELSRELGEKAPKTVLNSSAILYYGQ